MPFNFYDAITAGLWATTVMTAFLALALALGFIHLDFARLLGGIFLPLERKAEWVGLLLHMAIGVLFGLLYGFLFSWIDLKPILWMTITVGLGFGLYHWVLSMPLISIGRILNRHIKAGEERDPGTWGIQFGPQEALVRLFAYLLYGGTFGLAWSLLAMVGQTALAGRGIGLLLAVLLAAIVIGVYTSWLHAPAIEERYAFASGSPSEGDLRDRERRALRQRFERGEISWEQYQHLRRQFAAEP